MSGNRVTIDLNDDLEPDTRYEVRIDNGAITDLAGNPFRGSRGRDTLDFETADDDDNDQESLEGDRSFLPSSDPVIEIQPGAGNDEGFVGDSGLGSDDRIEMVGSPGTTLSFDDPVTVSRDAGAMAAATDEVGLSANGSAVAAALSNPLQIEGIAPIIVTSQGLP